MQNTHRYIYIFRTHTHICIFIYAYLEIDIYIYIENQDTHSSEFLHFLADRSAKPISARECSPEMYLNMANVI